MYTTLDSNLFLLKHFEDDFFQYDTERDEDRNQSFENFFRF